MTTYINDSFKREYYKPGRYFRPSKEAPVKLAKLTGYTPKQAEEWLLKQPIYQIYLPPPDFINYPRESFKKQVNPNDKHKANILYLPHDKGYKYALTLVDVASRYKAAYPLKTKTLKEVCDAFKHIYKNDKYLKLPIQLSVDKGKELFYREVTAYFPNIIRSHDLTHIVERFNRTLGEHIFSIQHNEELKTNKTNRQWVDNLQPITDEINNTYTRLIKMKPIDAVKLKEIIQHPSSSFHQLHSSVIKVGDIVRYLLKDSEGFDGPSQRRATDPIWSTDVYSRKNNKL